MKKVLFILLMLMFPCVVFSQNRPVGIFEDHLDIGNPKYSGSAVYSESDQSYLLTGSGYNIWFARDEFQYLYKKLKGNFILTAQFEFIGEGTAPHRKIGWMVRESLDESASHISAVLHGDGLTVMQWRAKKGDSMRDPEDEIFAPEKNYQILQLERKGKKIIFRASKAGQPLEVIGMHKMNYPGEEVMAGLFICAHNPDVIEKARVWNVKIED